MYLRITLLCVTIISVLGSETLEVTAQTKVEQKNVSNREFKARVADEFPIKSVGLLDKHSEALELAVLKTNFNIPNTISFDLPFTTYDYGWNSGPLDQVRVDDNGNVHLVFMLSSQNDYSDRHVFYIYNPGKPDQIGAIAAAPPSGWGDLSLTEDGRAAVGYHTPSTFAVDASPGIGNFTSNGGPSVGGQWGQWDVTSGDFVVLIQSSDDSGIHEN